MACAARASAQLRAQRRGAHHQNHHHPTQEQVIKPIADPATARLFFQDQKPPQKNIYHIYLWKKHVPVLYVPACANMCQLSTVTCGDICKHLRCE